jgi:hypothetical protein
MCPIRFEEITIDHLLVFEKDNATFAAARDNGHNHLRIFLAYHATGNVYTRNGRADSWEELTGESRSRVLDIISAARDNHAPVYRINGSYAR